MSTFKGIVVEFPEIRIDYFRPAGDEKARPPLAYFLSHVHSDHLAGLESCKSPFVYCSPGTAEILLRLKKYPHRMNFAKGILETRKQTYRHLKKLLKTIPLETPTTLELSPGNSIRVTLFDANHCVGAVMFLIEGGGNAILYTGDIRSELWWVNSLVRNPLFIPFVGRTPIKRLDAIYLDTTFASSEKPYKCFPSKADGVTELLQKVAKYPRETTFYLDSWTFGYEDVWVALSAFLQSQVHVDTYRYGLYRALANGSEPRAPESSKLMGFNFGNHAQQGCLTDRDSCRIHSCERGTGCPVFSKDFVRITPIISRHEGIEMRELGAGGGHGDLNELHELDTSNTELVDQLMAFCSSRLQDQPEMLSNILKLLASAIDSNNPTLALEDLQTANDGPSQQSQDPNDFADLDSIPLERLVPALANMVARKTRPSDAARPMKSTLRSDGLPKHITFPYSRHSSYDEMCYLIEELKPKEIFPCTVDEANWTASSSMSYLFGHIYAKPPIFRHDQFMLKTRPEKRRRSDLEDRPQDEPQVKEARRSSPANQEERPRNAETEASTSPEKQHWPPSEYHTYEAPAEVVRSTIEFGSEEQQLQLSEDEAKLAFRQQAYAAALDGKWNIGLVSVEGHQTKEEEL